MEDQHQEFFQTIATAYQQAVNRTGGYSDRYYTIASRIFRLRFAGTEIIPHLTSAIAHLETKVTSTPEFTICIWDNQSTNTRLPLLLAHMVHSLSAGWAVHLDSRGEARRFSSQQIRTAFHPGPDILSVLNTQENFAYYWVEDARQLPYFERGSPLRTLLHWWLDDENYQFVHAGAVGNENGGVLLVGKGGSGKSTTALACLVAGMQYASDDYCLISTTPEPYVFSVYNTAKLVGKEDLDRFPSIASFFSNLDRLQEEKAMIFLQEHYPQKLAKGFPIRALLLPKVTNTPQTRLRRISAGLALTALAPTTLAQLPGSGKTAIRTMSQLIRQVPCYALELGSKINQIPPVIQSLLT
jgi:hypothetical protein